MRRINLAGIVILFLFSCRNNNTETTKTDSLAIDSSIALSTDLDTSDVPTEEEVIDAEHTLVQQEDNEDFDYTYEGLVNNQIKVRLNIFKFHGAQKARVVYLSSKKIINMEAVYTGVGTFELTEKIAGKSTGVWKIANQKEDVFSGTWSSPDGTKQMPVKLDITNEAFDNFLPKEEIKTGFYQLKQMNEDPETKDEFPALYSEELFVKNMAGTTIYFDLYIQGSPPGVHVGMISGIASKSGNSFVYKNDNGCEITMSFSGNAVTLSQKGSDMNCEFGAGIGAFGTLEKRND